MRGADLTVQTIQDLFEGIARILGSLEERVFDPEVRLYDNLAMVSARSEVIVDSEVARAGTNAISLHKIDGEWKITSISDTTH